jgi:hypothetical protein
MQGMLSAERTSGHVTRHALPYGILPTFWTFGGSLRPGDAGTYSALNAPPDIMLVPCIPYGILPTFWAFRLLRL